MKKYCHAINIIIIIARNDCMNGNWWVLQLSAHALKNEIFVDAFCPFTSRVPTLESVSVNWPKLFSSWAGQLIPLIESESIRELLRTVHPSMRRDVRTLFLFLPYVLLHSIMSKNNPQYVQEEILAVIGEFLVLSANESYLNNFRTSYLNLRINLIIQHTTCRN